MIQSHKDLAHRYVDVTSLVADLEDALALEAARQGTSTGEATAVIRTLPARARRRLPFRMRHSLPVLLILGLLRWADPLEPQRTAVMAATGGTYAAVSGGPADTCLQHSAAPHGDAMGRAHVVNAAGLEVATHARGLDVHDGARAEANGALRDGCGHDRLVEAHRRAEERGQLRVADEVVVREWLLDQQQA